MSRPSEQKARRRAARKGRGKGKALRKSYQGVEVPVAQVKGRQRQRERANEEHRGFIRSVTAPRVTKRGRES